ncbi:SDR family NAD(P)-dependent oxidoreductase [Demequina sp. SO4-13]|uniref:SDR family NAD(P)-dependent oxidoreductase n=1 Tax=Demequina sp. SO4-13 TaxID=3401027 RepID=UPI003AF7B7F4
MDMRLDHSRAFISGSTQGIGFAIAAGLAAEGAEVILNGRDAARVDAAAARLRAAVPGAVVSALPADLSVASQVGSLLRDLGEIDILVNNVGEFEVKEFADVSDSDWAQYVEVNVMSGVRLSRHSLPRMLSRGTGRIIFISSESGVDVPANMIHYGATKAAVVALSNGLAKLTRGTDVTVNTILGGPTYSAGVASTVRQIAESQGVSEKTLKGTLIAGSRTSLLERFIDPEEIAALAVYLASPVSSATNGAALRADGGVLTTAT